MTAYPHLAAFLEGEIAYRRYKQRIEDALNSVARRHRFGRQRLTIGNLTMLVYLGENPGRTTREHVESNAVPGFGWYWHINTLHDRRYIERVKVQGKRGGALQLTTAGQKICQAFEQLLAKTLGDEQLTIGPVLAIERPGEPSATVQMH